MFQFKSSSNWHFGKTEHFKTKAKLLNLKFSLKLSFEFWSKVLPARPKSNKLNLILYKSKHEIGAITARIVDEAGYIMKNVTQTGYRVIKHRCGLEFYTKKVTCSFVERREYIQA